MMGAISIPDIMLSCVDLTRLRTVSMLVYHESSARAVHLFSCSASCTAASAGRRIDQYISFLYEERFTHTDKPIAHVSHSPPQDEIVARIKESYKGHL